MKRIAALTGSPLACLIGALASCGGASAPAESASSTTLASTLHRFLTTTPALDFFAPQAPSGIALQRISGAKLGDLTLVLSNYLCQDPTGSGALLTHPARTGQLASYALGKNEQGADAATVAMTGLQFQIPLTGALVLVEVIDHSRNIALYGKLVAPVALDGLKIAVPEMPLLASCAAPV